jgi:DNA-binding LacI/PurR family transcriptional regulator
MLCCGGMKPSLKDRGTLNDVAKIVGVSVASVSYAFSRPHLLSSAVRERILAAARSLNYPGPNPAARMLRTGYAGSIAVVYNNPLRRPFEDAAFAAFLEGVADACGGRFGLLLLQGGEDSLGIIQTAAIDGLVVFSMPKDDVTLRTVTDRALPMIVVDSPKLPGIPFLGIDEGAAARACAQHLKDLGHKSFGIVSFKLGADGHCGFIDRKRVKNSCYGLNRSRIEGYLEVLDNGGAVSLKLWEWPRSNEEGGRIAAESFFRERARPTAILAASDRLGIGIIEAARRQQLRVPQDLAVVGFDGIPAAKFISPHLTTINQPLAEKGRLAVAALLKEKPPMRTKLATKLVIRQSSDPAILGADEEREIDIR